MNRITFPMVAILLGLALAGVGAAEQAGAGSTSSAAPAAGAETPPIGVIGEIKPRPELQTLEGVKAWVVNGKDIPMTKIEKLGALYRGPYILQDLVAQLLLEQEAARKNITLTEQEIDQTVTDLRQQLGLRSDPAFESFLRTQNATSAWFRDKAHAYALMRKVLADQVYVSDAEVESFFQRNQQMYRRGAVVAFRLMVFQSKPAAEAALAEVRKGKSFQDVAKATSQDPTLAEGLQYYEQGQQGVPQELSNALLAAPLNQVTGPMAMGGWFYLIKVEQKIDPHQFTLDEVRPVIRQQLGQEKLEQVVWPNWINNQLKNANIQVIKAQ